MDKPWLKFYEPGVPEEITYPEGMLVQHILEHSAAKCPNRPATIFPAAVGTSLLEGRLTYRDLESAANRCANALFELGIQQGDRVALLLPDSPQCVIAYFGALKAGAIVVAFDLGCTPPELERQLNDCGAETIVTTTNVYPMVKQLQPLTHLTRVIATNIKDYFHPVVSALFALFQEKKAGFRAPLHPRDYSFARLLRDARAVRPRVAASPDDLALLQYAGGATGAPKGALLTHRNLVSNCLQRVAWRREAETEHEATLCFIPFCHLYGLQSAMLDNLYRGGALILFPKFELAEVLLAIDKYRPTLFAGVPTHYSALINYKDLHKHNLKSIRVWLSGAAPLPAEVQTEFENFGGRLVEGYGLTAAGALTHASPLSGERRVDSIGIPVPSTVARIVEPAAVDVELPVGAVGALALKGPQVFRGYWNRPAETKTWRNGWLITGDLARMDADGFFYIVACQQES